MIIVIITVIMKRMKDDNNSNNGKVNIFVTINMMIMISITFISIILTRMILITAGEQQ